MMNLNPEELLDAYREECIEYSEENFIEYFREERSVNHLLTIYTFLEDRKDKRADELKDLMEHTVGKSYIEKYGIAPKEAVALKLLELSIGLELLNRDDIPSPHHVHALFRINKEKHVINLDIVEVGSPSLNCLKLLSFLKSLKISMSNLTVFKGFKNLTRLEWLQLNGNEIKEIQHINLLKNLIRLEIDNNPIKIIHGIKKLKKLTEIIMFDTNIPTSIKREIDTHIKRNRLRITKERDGLLQVAEKFVGKGDYYKAIRNYEEAERLSESLFPIGWGSQHFLSSKDWYNLAIAYLNVQNYKEALKSCTQALKLNSKYKTAQELRETIINLNEEFKC
jgi:tetratricopeptide (TPR) repeat protein